LRTGDVGILVNTMEGKGHEHVFIVYRIKEMIKVRGHQVAPAELEGCLLEHPSVADVAVIGVPDVASGEVPKSCVVITSQNRDVDFDSMEELMCFVRKEKAHFKWLKGGIEFIDAIPKSASGKILRKELRDTEKVKRREQAGRV
ncbi:acetyl-CoA synthetase-like protein, partial [Lophiostoma macrostomum CBS 122681]